MSAIAISDLAAPPVARSAPLSSELLADIAAGLAASEELWRPHAHHDPDGRRPVRLVVVRPLGGVGGGVDTGTARRRCTTTATRPVCWWWSRATSSRCSPPARTGCSAPGRPATSSTCRSGSCTTSSASGPGPSTSIHVYSPPLGTMTYYDDDGRPVRVEKTDDEPAVTDLRSVSRALHPSQRRG